VRACVVLSVLFAVGCNRTHLYPSFGQAARRAFAAQAIDPQAGAAKKSEAGLDPDEAAIVADSYKKSLVPKRGNVNSYDQSRILVVDPQAPSTQANGDAK
jgi:hypothetical protein